MLSAMYMVLTHTIHATTNNDDLHNTQVHTYANIHTKLIMIALHTLIVERYM